MKKRGISPLIAVVILIGFTVLLAAIIIFWGGDFLKSTTESATIGAGQSISCSQVNFEIEEVYSCANTNQNPPNEEGFFFIARIANNADTEIEDLILRATTDKNEFMVDLEALDFELEPIDGYEIRLAFFYTPGEYWQDVPAGLSKVEAIPKIKVDDEIITCDNVVEVFDSFGDDCLTL